MQNTKMERYDALLINCKIATNVLGLTRNISEVNISNEAYPLTVRPVYHVFLFLYLFVSCFYPEITFSARHVYCDIVEQTV